MATPKKGPKTPKVGSYRGGTKTSVGGRGGFLGKTTSGGNLGRAAMTNSGAVSAARNFGRSGGDASAFGIGGGVGVGAGGGGGAIGVPGGDNTSGAGVDWSSGGLTETTTNPGGTAYNPVSSFPSADGGLTGPLPEVPVDTGQQAATQAAYDAMRADMMGTGGVTLPANLGPAKVGTAAAPTRTAAAPATATSTVKTVAAQPGTTKVTSSTGVTRTVSSGAAPVSAALYETNPTPTPKPAASTITTPVRKINTTPTKL